MNPYIVLSVIVACVLSGFGGGYKVREWMDDSTKVVAQAAKIQDDKLAASATALLAQKNYADGMAAATKVQKTRVVYRTIIKEIPNELAKLGVANVVAPGAVRVLHDNAARGVSVDPTAAAGTDATPVTIGDITATVAANYEIAHVNADTLEALQQYVTTQCLRTPTKGKP